MSSIVHGMHLVLKETSWAGGTHVNHGMNVFNRHMLIIHKSFLLLYISFFIVYFLHGDGWYALLLNTSGGILYLDVKLWWLSDDHDRFFLSSSSSSSFFLFKIKPLPFFLLFSPRFLCSTVSPTPYLVRDFIFKISILFLKILNSSCFFNFEFQTHFLNLF